jgi:hypothetical protein
MYYFKPIGFNLFSWKRLAPEDLFVELHHGNKFKLQRSGLVVVPNQGNKFKLRRSGLFVELKPRG